MGRAILFCLGLFAVALGAAGPALSADRIKFTDAEIADLDRISDYLNSIHTMKGGFSQIDPDGDVDQGTFAIAKPGRMRFEYKPPAATLIVSDGHTVAVQNSKLKTVDRYPLGQTPLNLVLGDHVDLAHDKSIVGIVHRDDAVVVRARSRNGNSQGDITLVFSDPNLELRQWTVIDDQGLQTTVALRDVQIGADVSGIQFTVPDKNPFAHKQAD